MVNTGYIEGLLARAFRTAATHEDAVTRARADEKLQRFESVLTGMREGTLAVGSRTPVEGAPAWATLEVARGGFATGALLAGGALLPHEEAALARDDLPAGSTPRTRLNMSFLSERGLASLVALLDNGRYRIDVPEEGALLVVAWLLAHGERPRAIEVLDVIAPFFDRLRFYPAPAERPLAESAVVRLQPLANTRAALAATKPQRQVQRMNETLRIWAPFEDRVVALFRETIVEGAPLRHVLGDWQARAKALHTEYLALAAKHPLCRRHSNPKANLARLLWALQGCSVDAARLSRREIGVLKATLAAIEAKRGAPGTPAHAQLRATQSAVAALPTNKDLADVVIGRLRGLPDEGGLGAIEPVATPLSAAEAARVGCAVGFAVPPSLVAKLLRSLEAPIEELVERGIIPSGEVLATVAPQITAHVRAAGIADPDLRRVYGAVYSAFRRRRSLLLLNLEHQVRLEELPWIAVIDGLRTNVVETKALQRATLEQLTALAIISFPDVILPNKLLQELGALAKGAALDLPLVEELAADIFMGTFSSKFVQAAKVAARLLRGTLYERYYGVDFERVLALPDPPARKKGARSAVNAPEFAELCKELAGADDSSASVARSGTIIEQQQIVTTHNLAVLFDAFGLVQKLDVRLGDMARACFVSICEQHAIDIDDWRSRLQRLKNTAYSWRQMVFFLALAPPGTVEAFLPWADEHMHQHAFERFAPALRGLRVIAAGGEFVDGRTVDDELNDAYRFLGWTTGKHWLHE